MTINIFIQEHIIESYRLEALLNSKLCDFLPSIGKNRWEQKVLNTWKAHFIRNGCPWALTLSNGKYILWKIDERATPAEIAKIRKDPKQRWFQE